MMLAFGAALAPALLGLMLGVAAFVLMAVLQLGA
jgi:hypothetical protein